MAKDKDNVSSSSATASKAVWEIHQLLEHDKKRLVCKIDNTQEDIKDTAPMYVPAGRYLAKLVDVDGKVLDSQFLVVRGDEQRQEDDYEVDMDSIAQEQQFDPVEEIEKIAARKARIEMLNSLGKNGDDRLARIESLLEKQANMQIQMQMQPRESTLEKTLAAIAPIALKMMEPRESTVDKLLPILVPLLPKLFETKETTSDKLLPVLLTKLEDKRNPIAEAMPFVEMFSGLYQKNYEKEIKMQEKLLDHKYGDPIERKKQAFLEGLDALASRVNELAMVWRSSKQESQQAHSQPTNEQKPQQEQAQTQKQPQQNIFKDVIDLLQAGVETSESAQILLNKYGRDKISQVLNDKGVKNVVEKRGGAIKELFDHMAGLLAENEGNSDEQHDNNVETGTNSEIQSI